MLISKGRKNDICLVPKPETRHIILQNAYCPKRHADTHGAPTSCNWLIVLHSLGDTIREALMPFYIRSSIAGMSKTLREEHKKALAARPGVL